MKLLSNEKYIDGLGNFSLTYSLNNNLPGSAAGDISLSSDAIGSYSLYWGKDGSLLKINCGEKMLSYSALHTFEFIEGTSKQSIKILGFTAIPVGADSIILTDENKAPIVSLELPREKLLPETPHKYSFGVIADIHYNYFFNHDKTIDYAVDAIDRALDFYKKAGVSIVTAVGDYGIYSEEKSYQDYSKAVEKSGVTVIACGGNHELYAKIPVMYGENGYWRTYMNKGVYDRTLEGVIDIASNGIDFTYSVPGHESEVFVSLSQWYWDGHTSKQPKLLEPQQLDWLEEQFIKYSDKTVYLLFHTYLSDDDGENVDGEGDLRSTGGYSYNGHYNIHTPDEKRLRSLLTKYRNVIWFNGHSHYEYSMQVYNENLNIFDYEGTTATMVHVPSVTNPRTVRPEATTYNSLRGKASQGAFQFIYDGFQIMNGTDLWNDEILSYACYIIYTDKSSIIKEGKIGEDITWTYDAQLNSLRLLGTGKIEIDVCPWKKYSDSIMRLYTGKGITEIGKNTFSELTNLSRAEIKEGVCHIKGSAFSSKKLDTLILPETLYKIDENAFSLITPAAKEVIYDGTIEKWSMIDKGSSLNITKPPHCRKVTVTFKGDDFTESFDVPLGSVPCYEWIPARNHPDEEKYYIFMGWYDGENTYSPAEHLPPAKCNVTYTASFGAEGKRFISVALAFGEITWSLDRRYSCLVLSGKGAIPDFNELNDRPWDPYAAAITKVVVTNGITDVGANAFKQLHALKCVILEEGIKTVGKDALGYNKLLKEVYIPSTLKELGRGSVYLSDNIEKVFYGGTKEDWKAFCDGITTYYNTNLTNVKNIICK